MGSTTRTSVSKVSYKLVEEDDGSDTTLTVFIPNADKPYTITPSTNPNFDKVLDMLIKKSYKGVNELVKLLDLPKQVQVAFNESALSERVQVTKQGDVRFDGDLVDNSITKQILKAIEQGQEVDPLVQFFEKIQLNPLERSKQQLFDWLGKHDFSIFEDGDILAYKGVLVDGTGYKSKSSGTAFVNGKEIKGQIPQKLGDVVTMPRSEVIGQPTVACGVGLHIANFRFAKTFVRGKVLAVKVNPRDVVSVPSDSSYEKIRCCRYVVVEEVTEAYSVAIVAGTRTVQKGVAQAVDQIADGIPESDRKQIEKENKKAVKKDTAKGVTAVSTAQLTKEQKFNELAATAKRSKKGLKKFLESKGWKIKMDKDPENMNNWTMPK